AGGGVRGGGGRSGGDGSGRHCETQQWQGQPRNHANHQRLPPFAGVCRGPPPPLAAPPPCKLRTTPRPQEGGRRPRLGSCVPATFLGPVCHRSSADCVLCRKAACRPNFSRLVVLQITQVTPFLVDTGGSKSWLFVKLDTDEGLV